MGIDQLRLIDTGLDPVTAEREQWDDGNNTLALAPKVAVAYERNEETNERLIEAGIEVIAIAGSELGFGPRRAAVHVLPDRPGLTEQVPDANSSVTSAPKYQKFRVRASSDLGQLWCSRGEFEIDRSEREIMKNVYRVLALLLAVAA